MRTAETVEAVSHRPSPRPLLLRVLLAPTDPVFRFVGHRYGSFIRFVSTAPPRLLQKLGYWRAVRAADHARRRVPAFVAFYGEHAVTRQQLRRLQLPPR